MANLSPEERERLFQDQASRILTKQLFDARKRKIGEAEPGGAGGEIEAEICDSSKKSRNPKEAGNHDSSPNQKNQIPSNSPSSPQALGPQTCRRDPSPAK